MIMQPGMSVGVWAVPAALVQIVAPWSRLYSHSKVVSSIVTFGHIASLLMGGGLALATDRATLRAIRAAGAERTRHLDALATVHRTVLVGLTLSLGTGVLLLAADLETFLGSWVFWLKMALVALLLGNGALMGRAESALQSDGRDDAPAWSALRRSAIVSMVLWYAVTLAGVVLVNAA